MRHAVSTGNRLFRCFALFGIVASLLLGLFTPLAAPQHAAAQAAQLYAVIDIATVGTQGATGPQPIPIPFPFNEVGLNNAGQSEATIGGFTFLISSFNFRAARTNGATATDLGTLRPDDLGFGFGTDINASGQVVGQASTADLPPSPGTGRAFRTGPNEPIELGPGMVPLPRTGDDLGTLRPDGLGNSSALGIDDAGRVVGQAQDLDGEAHAFRTAPNAAIFPADDLGTLAGDTDSPPDGDADGTSAASDINAAGQVVGQSTTVGGPPRAFRTAANSAIAPTNDLGTLCRIPANPCFSSALDINAAGDVVGLS